MALGAILGGGLNLLGGIFGRRSADRAAREQTAAAERANALMDLRGQQARNNLIDRAYGIGENMNNLALLGPEQQVFVPAGQRAFGNYNALLGLDPGGQDAANAAFNNFLNSTGFNFAMQTGRDAITGSRAAAGLLNSGRTGAALTDFGHNLGRQAFDNYLSRLEGITDRGVDADRWVRGTLERGINRQADMATQAELAPLGLAGQMGANIMSAGQNAAQLRQQGSQDLWSGIGGAYGALRDGGVFNALGRAFGGRR